jgi:hypothetical protein
MSVDFCRACGASIEWGWTENGKRMPLDTAHYGRDDETANVAVRNDHTGRLWARVLREDRPLVGFERRRMPHFATCRARRPSSPPTPAAAPARLQPLPPRIDDELAARRRRRQMRGTRA